MDDYANLRIVKAKYNFKGKNNDELCFKKGDYIVLTQPIDSDWWEGTLDGVTGWFPVSYVQEIRPEQLPDDQKQLFFGNKAKQSGQGGQHAPTRSYHSEVLAGVIETETSFVAELEQGWNMLIQPISGANILTKEEFQLVSSNYEEIVSLHRSFLVALKECAKQALNVRRVGRVFLDHAPAFRIVYERYASNHPRAVRILHAQKQRTSSSNLGRFIAERTGTSTNNNSTTPADVQMLLPLTTALALPLCRLEKLPLTLRELERHLDEGHFDRGDTQRALSLFRQLIADCQELRLLRELELDLANASVANLPSILEATGPENSHKLAHGVVFLSPVKLATGSDIVDRLFVLYPTRLVILSAEPDLTKLAFEAEFPLTHLYVERSLPNPDVAKRFLHSFSLYFRPVVPLASPEESAGGSTRNSQQNDCFVVVCSSSSLCSRWIDLLSSVCTSDSSLSAKSSSHSDENGNKTSSKQTQPPQQIIAEQQRRRSTSLNQFQAPISHKSPFALSPLSCVVSNSAAMTVQPPPPLAVQALAPASPHPNRKPTALTIISGSSGSTPLARKKLAISNAAGPQLMMAPGGVADHQSEDQQLMQIVESFVSTPQMVPIERAQSGLSPSNSETRLYPASNGHGGPHLISNHPLTIEPIIHSNNMNNISNNSGIGLRPQSNASRNTSASVLNSNRHELLIAEEEKLLLEELKPLNDSLTSGGTAGLQERTLVDAVYALWDYVAELRGEVARLRQQQQ